MIPRGGLETRAEVGGQGGGAGGQFAVGPSGAVAVADGGSIRRACRLLPDGTIHGNEGVGRQGRGHGGEQRAGEGGAGFVPGAGAI